MKSPALRALWIAAMLAAVVGCKSGPRFAWWKRDKAPEDTSLVARSAAPALPSTQSTPQAVTVDGLTPAAPPSSANLAVAAGTTQPSVAGAIPATSSTTIASAPLATYPSASSISGSPNATAVATVPQISAASAPGTGPYDPNGYTASATTIAATSPATATATTADRYGSTSDSYAAASAYTSSPVAAAPVDRYAIPAATAANVPPSGAVYGQVPTDPYAPPLSAASAVATTPTTAAPAATAAVRVSSPPGLYRPGGTSSYSAGSTAQHIEVASRPTEFAPTTPPAQENATAPTGASAPWSPPTSSNSTPGAWTY